MFFAFHFTERILIVIFVFFLYCTLIARKSSLRKHTAILLTVLDSLLFNITLPQDSREVTLAINIVRAGNTKNVQFPILQHLIVVLDYKYKKSVSSQKRLIPIYIMPFKQYYNAR